MNDKNKQKWFNTECKRRLDKNKQAVFEFNNLRNDSNRKNLLDAKKDYKYYCRNCKAMFNRELGRKMNSMRKKTPKEFWRLFKQNTNKNSGETISNEEFYNYFKNLSNINADTSDAVSENLLHEFDNSQQTESTYPEMDLPISVEEIVNATKKLGYNKACSLDNVIYEQRSIPVISQSLGILFNFILDTGQFSPSWSTGMTKPLYKKGNPEDTNNYRGITLVSCFAKLFTVVLNERLKKWSTKYDKLTEAQFGFKQDYSTVDAIFILNSLIEAQLKNSKKLFSCFIDFKKAFDYVNRSQLWVKLLK